jgi:hypothetical protein
VAVVGEAVVGAKVVFKNYYRLLFEFFQKAIAPRFPLF